MISLLNDGDGIDVAVQTFNLNRPLMRWYERMGRVAVEFTGEVVEEDDYNSVVRYEYYDDSRRDST